MSVPEFKELLSKYNSGLCTNEEKALIETWYMGFELKDLPELTDAQLAEILSLKSEIVAESKVRPLFKWLSAAAAILIFIIAGIYFAGNRNAVQQVAQNRADVLPGSDKAVLTLSNGKKIILNGAQNGRLAYQGNMAVSKSADGKIEYTAVKQAGNAPTPVFNTMSTPRGGQYHLVLADGTGVWLNAASSIKYPAQFTANERLVEITGEAYFEVAHDKTKPFRVVSKGQITEVLGTHFNVNAYDDEAAVKTTLFEGSVRIFVTGGISKTNGGILKPGEQSVLVNNNIKISDADTEEAIAWKNGDFVFRNQTLPEIMKKVSRWYDVEVSYQDESNRQLTFSGVVSRSRNLSAVLKMLELTGQVKFRIQGNQVKVINQQQTL